MADVKTVLEKLDLSDFEVTKSSPKQSPFKELTEAQILEINDKLKAPQRHGGHLGIGRSYRISMAQVRAIADIRKDVITAKKKALPPKDPEEPVKDPIKDPVKDLG